MTPSNPASRAIRRQRAWRLADRLVGAQHGVAAEQAVGFQGEGAFGAVGEEADGGHRHHRQHQCAQQHAHFTGASLLEEPRELRTLIRRDVHEEEVGRIRRKAALPVAEQIIPDDREHQQHHDAERECRELHDALRASPSEVRDAVAP